MTPAPRVAALAGVFLAMFSMATVKTASLVCRRRSSGWMYRHAACKARSALRLSCSAGLKSRRVPTSSDSLDYGGVAFWTPFAAFRTFYAGRCKCVASRSFAALRTFPPATGQLLPALDRVAGIAAALAPKAHQASRRKLGIAEPLFVAGMEVEHHSSPTLLIS